MLFVIFRKNQLLLFSCQTIYNICIQSIICVLFSSVALKFSTGIHQCWLLIEMFCLVFCYLKPFYKHKIQFVFRIKWRELCEWNELGSFVRWMEKRAIICSWCGKSKMNTECDALSSTNEKYKDETNDRRLNVWMNEWIVNTNVHTIWTDELWLNRIKTIYWCHCLFNA